MSMAGAGKATIARITAERFGCKDEALLQLIEKLAAADIVIGKPAFCPKSNSNPDFYELTGTMDGKDFRLVLSGPAVDDFA